MEMSERRIVLVKNEKHMRRLGIIFMIVLLACAIPFMVIWGALFLFDSGIILIFLMYFFFLVLPLLFISFRSAECIIDLDAGNLTITIKNPAIHQHREKNVLFHEIENVGHRPHGKKGRVVWVELMNRKTILIYNGTNEELACAVISILEVALQQDH